MPYAACCLPSTALLVEAPPQEKVPQHPGSDSVSPHVGNKAGVFPAAVFKFLCRRSVKELQWDLRDSSMNLTLTGSLPSKLLLHSNKSIFR